MVRRLFFILFLAATLTSPLLTGKVKAQDKICQPTDQQFLLDIYHGSPKENAARIKLYTQSGYGSAALVSIKEKVFVMTAGHVAWQANLQDMHIFVPDCGVLPGVIDPNNYVVYKESLDNIMLYPIDDDIAESLEDIVEPLTLSGNQSQPDDTVYFPSETSAELLPYQIIAVSNIELFAVMWYEGDEVCISMSGSPAFDTEGNIVGVLSSAPLSAESNLKEKCFLQAFIIPVR